MSLPQVTLVDIAGRPISADDQGDAAQWPVSNTVDGWHWTLTPDMDDVRAEAEAEAEAEVYDFPSRRQVSPIELSLMGAGMAIG